MLSEEDIEAGRTATGGFSRAQLAAWGVPWPPPKGWKQDLLARENTSGSTRTVQKPRGLTWIPVYTANQVGRRVTLTGTARARLSDKIIVRKSVDVKDLQNRAIGKIDSIRNDGGSLTVVFLLNDGASNPGGKFLLGLRRQGLHVSYALSAADPRPGDESAATYPSSRAYPGMLGEQL